MINGDCVATFHGKNLSTLLGLTAVVLTMTSALNCYNGLFVNLSLSHRPCCATVKTCKTVILRVFKTPSLWLNIVSACMYVCTLFCTFASRWSVALTTWHQQNIKDKLEIKNPYSIWHVKYTTITPNNSNIYLLSACDTIMHTRASHMCKQRHQTGAIS